MFHVKRCSLSTASAHMSSKHMSMHLTCRWTHRLTHRTCMHHHCSMKSFHNADPSIDQSSNGCIEIHRLLEIKLEWCSGCSGGNGCSGKRGCNGCNGCINGGGSSGGNCDRSIRRSIRCACNQSIEHLINVNILDIFINSHLRLIPCCMTRQ